MVKLQRRDARELGWTVAGAVAGSLTRSWIEPHGPKTFGALTGLFLLTCVMAALVGFAYAASIRGPLQMFLIAAGGAAASISVAATWAASATPLVSFIGVGAFFVGAFIGFLSGLLVALGITNRRRAQRS
jgi:hypothetical protein